MLLEVKSVSSGYFRKQVLRDVSLSIGQGEVVGLIGHNGAGKTTALKTILGLIRADVGDVIFDGRSIAGSPAVRNVREGLTLIPQERFTFPDLTVAENLVLGGHQVRDAKLRDRTLSEIHELFPILKARGAQRAGTLSGGQQRVLSMAMAMMAHPRLVLVDEPSLGLSPLAVEEVGRIIARMGERGIGVLLVDQNIKQTLRLSHRVYVMKSGRIVLEDTGESLLRRGEWWDLF
jgi:branched-chain amino acid transport system ATP-binding protein